MCNPLFEKSLNFACVKELIAEAKDGKITVDTLKKGLWILGCGVEFFVPTQLIGSETPDQENKSIEELCNEIEMYIEPTTFGSDEINDEEKAKNPMLWLGIASLVIQIIQFLRKK